MRYDGHDSKRGLINSSFSHLCFVRSIGMRRLDFIDVLSDRDDVHRRDF